MTFQVRMWLSVYEKRCPIGDNTLWVKDLVTDVAPREGDMLHLTVAEEDGTESDVSWYVYRHYWEHSGLYTIQLSNLIKDPAEDAIQGHGKYACFWWTDRDGDPEPILRRGGWVTWEEWEAAK